MKDVDIAERIVTYIVKNAPVTLSKIEEIAKNREWYTPHRFEQIMLLISKDTRISGKVSPEGNDVVYRIRVVRKRIVTIDRLNTGQAWREYLRTHPPFPEDDVPFKICGCSSKKIRYLEWEFTMGHWPECDAVRFQEEYRAQNPWDRSAGKVIDIDKYGDEKERKRKQYTARNYSHTRKPLHTLLEAQQQRFLQSKAK